MQNNDTCVSSVICSCCSAHFKKENSQNTNLGPQFYQDQPKQGLTPLIKKPQTIFSLYIHQSACVDTVSDESRHRVAALGRVGHIFRKTCTELSTSYLELQNKQK